MRLHPQVARGRLHTKGESRKEMVRIICFAIFMDQF